jgi:hypothetical protein
MGQEWLISGWQSAVNFFNSTFFVSLITAGLGAFAGAWAAQRIADKGKYRDQLLREMRDTNAATMMSFAICNSLLSMKKQHIKRLKEDFDKERAAYLDYLAKKNAGQIPPNTVFHFMMDLQTLSLQPLPLDILQAQVFDKISVVGRPLALTTTLRQTLHGLGESMERRNALIATFKQMSNVSPDFYFGLPLSSGHVSTEYRDTVESTHDQTDDGIFFSQMLCDDLVEHNEGLEKQYKNEFKKGSPDISKPEWKKGRDAGLMPDPAKYADWTSMFKKKAPPTSASYRRAKAIGKWVGSLSITRAVRRVRPVRGRKEAD